MLKEKEQPQPQPQQQQQQVQMSADPPLHEGIFGLPAPPQPALVHSAGEKHSLGQRYSSGPGFILSPCLAFSSKKRSETPVKGGGKRMWMMTERRRSSWSVLRSSQYQPAMRRMRVNAQRGDGYLEPLSQEESGASFLDLRVGLD